VILLVNQFSSESVEYFPIIIIIDLKHTSQHLSAGEHSPIPHCGIMLSQKKEIHPIPQGQRARPKNLCTYDTFVMLLPFAPL
jgi:hypothetical protein